MKIPIQFRMITFHVVMRSHLLLKVKQTKNIENRKTKERQRERERDQVDKV